MGKRIFAICLIFAGITIAWMVLAGTVSMRTSKMDIRLQDKVNNLWGTVQEQKAPTVTFEKTAPGPNNKAQTISGIMPLDGSDIHTDIKLDYRKKGLLWYPTYKVGFDGRYLVKNNHPEELPVTFNFNFPAVGAVYENFRLLVNGTEVDNIDMTSNGVLAYFNLKPGEQKNISVSYRSQGMNRWVYNFGQDVNQVKDFSMVMKTDFDKIDFPEQTISPTEKKSSGDGWELRWKYSTLFTGYKIGMVMPKKLNPGPWVTSVIYSAPVSLLLFFFLIFIISTVKKIKIHPVNYLFIGMAFFSFHLLLAYLVDHLSIHISFFISSLMSVLLVVSYMRLVAGKRFAFVEVGVSQFVYLVFFSYTFFFQGYTGLAITVLCILTLFVVMQITGKINWEKEFEPAT